MTVAEQWREIIRRRNADIDALIEVRDRMHQTITFLLSVVASGEKLSDAEEAGIRAMLREAATLPKSADRR